MWQRPQTGDRSEFTTTDPAEAHAFLRAAYVENTMRIAGSTESFRLRSTHHRAGDFAVNSLSHTMAVEHHSQPLGYVLVGRVLVGRVERETQGEVMRARAGDVFLVARPDRIHRTTWNMMRLQLIRVDLAALIGPDVPVDFAALEPVTTAAGQRLKRTINYACAAVLADPVRAGSPLIVGEASRLLGAAVLEAFRPRTPCQVRRTSDRLLVGPTSLRRAVTFVEAHAHTDIGLSDIAAAAGISRRAAQRAFRRHLGTSPLGYVRRVRLERAHDDLVVGDPTRETVTAVRIRWGFADAARFAATYRRTYGVTPEQALRH